MLQYHFSGSASGDGGSAAGNLASRVLHMRGKPVTADSFAHPLLVPVAQPTRLAPLTVAFIDIPDASAQACIASEGTPLFARDQHEYATQTGVGSAASAAAEAPKSLAVVPVPPVLPETDSGRLARPRRTAEAAMERRPPAPALNRTAMLDTVVFGQAASEASHGLAASGVDVAVARGQPCRTPCLKPASCRSGWPSGGAAHLAFRMKVDPAAQNYLTVKFDGSEVTATTAVTVLNQSFGGGVSDCAYPPELNLCFGTGDGTSENHCADPVFAGRWQYSTMLLPRSLTEGRADAPVTLTTLPGHTMQSVFRAYTHTSALPPLPAGELQPPPPAPAGPVPAPGPHAENGNNASSQFEFLLAQVDAGVERMMGMQLYGPNWDAAVAAAPDLAVLTGGIWPRSRTNATDFANLNKTQIKNECLGNSIGSNNNWFRGLEVMARAYHFAPSRHYRSAELLARVVAGVDFYQLAQGLNGGFDPRPRLPAGWIGAPERRNGSGCLEG